MADDFSGGNGRPSWLPFDLLGDPVPANKGAKARPQHAPTAENLEIAIVMYGLGRTDADVAAALQISVPTLKKYYFSNPDLRRAKRGAAMVLEGELLRLMMAQAKAGKTSATEKLLKRLDKSRVGAVPTAQAKPKKRPKGLKEERRDAAYEAGASDPDWADLIGPAAGNA